MGALIPEVIPTLSLPEFYKVSTEEGHEPEMILTTPALNAQFDRGGQRLLYEDDKSYENLWRKHNTSSLAHDIWFSDTRTGNHTKLTRDAGEHRNPIWAPDENSFFYLGEQSGSFNVWKLPVVDDGKAAAEQITHFEKNPIRFLSIDQAGDLCFGYDGEIYLLPRGATDPSKVNIQIAAATNTFKQQLHLNEGVTEIALSPNGKEIAFVIRGDVYVVSNKTVYARFLPFIVDDRDFAEMTSEMLGELNASHTGCYLTPITSGDQTASLGAFFDQSYSGSGIKIEEVIEKGPLSQTDPPLRTGMIIEKIDERTVTPGMDVSPLLNFKAGKPTALSIFDPAKDSRFVVTMKPIALGELEALLYERWVKQRCDLVDKLSNGTIGYTHVARMVDSAYRDTVSEALGRQVDKKALIVDTRWNPGGNMHDALATFLSGRRYIKFIPRGQVLGWEPGRKWYKETVLLTNEGNYSDGLIFPWAYKHFQLGKLIGMPVADSGSYVWWETLQDPALFFGIPEVGLQDDQGQFLERTQVDPDIEVINDPKSTAEGRDLQLERATAELMKEH